MVKLYTDVRMLDHQPHAGHPERPERLATVIRHLQRTGQLARLPAGECRLATDDELRRVHSESHIRQMGERALSGGGQVEEDTWLSAGSDSAARLAAGSVINAIEGVVAGDDRQAMCLVRPPGHHARPDDPMGFCLYGSVAVGAADAVARLGLNRVLIVDWDVHHGNGTQEMFYDSEQVGFFSIHRHPFYPWSGAANETGTGAGLGKTINVPVSFGTSRKDYLAVFRKKLESFADAFKPELIILSAGFDAHAEDPVGNLGLENEDYVEMTLILTQIAQNHTAGKLVTVLEGGYNPAILAGCVSEHIETIEKNDPGGI